MRPLTLCLRTILLEESQILDENQNNVVQSKSVEKQMKPSQNTL